MSEAVRGGASGVNFTHAAAAAMGRARDVSRSGNGVVRRVVRHRDGIVHLEADSGRGGSGGHGALFSL